MFTGLVEETGKITRIEQIPGGKRITIEASVVTDDMKIDDSVAVNGVCLTAVEVGTHSFKAEAVGATLDKTTLANIRTGSEANLERAVRLSDRLGGHLVQGHVNGIGRISGVKKLGDNYLVEITLPDDIMKYVVPEGSIAVDGISLTVADVKESVISLSIIPHTWKNTSLRNKNAGDNVNIETDIIAKYTEKLLNLRDQEDKKFTGDWFRDLGY